MHLVLDTTTVVSALLLFSSPVLLDELEEVLGYESPRDLRKARRSNYAAISGMLATVSTGQRPRSSQIQKRQTPIHGENPAARIIEFGARKMSPDDSRPVRRTPVFPFKGIFVISRAIMRRLAVHAQKHGFHAGNAFNGRNAMLDGRLSYIPHFSNPISRQLYRGEFFTEPGLRLRGEFFGGSQVPGLG